MAEDYRLIQKAAKKHNFDVVLKTADKLLKANPADELALHCKYYALIQLDDIKTAVGLFTERPGDGEKFLLEYGYCLYRGREDEAALSVLQKVPPAQRGPALWSLLAQVLYRRGQYVQAVGIYEKQLGALTLRDEQLVSNLLACYVSAGFPDKAVALARKMETPPSYEATYNVACALLDLGQLQSAQRCLEQAEAQHLASLKQEGADSAVVQDELAVLVVQMAYVLQKLGQGKEARAKYLQVLKQKPSDEAVLATANNNLITLRRRGEKIFEALKRSGRALKVPADRLSTRQLRAFRLNHCLLLVYGKKEGKAQEQIQALQAEFPASEMPILVLASLYFRRKDYGKCLATLEDYIEGHPQSALQARLTLAHIALSRKDVTGAVKALQSITECAHRPAVVATLVALRLESGAVSEAVAVLRTAIRHWQARLEAEMKDDGEEQAKSKGALVLQALLERAAALCEEHRQYADAVTFYKTLVERFSADPDEARRYRARLVAVACRADPGAAVQHAKALPLPAGLQVDVSALLDPASRAEFKLREKRRTKELKAPTDAPAERKGAAKKRRKKKPRFPKGFDPSKPGPAPDPERWLPRWERTYNQKLRKKRKMGFRGAQGGMPVAMELADGVLRKAPPKEQKEAKQTRGTGKQQKKKKKKKKKMF